METFALAIILELSRQDGLDIVFVDRENDPLGDSVDLKGSGTVHIRICAHQSLPKSQILMAFSFSDGCD